LLREARSYIGIPFCRAGASLLRQFGIHDFGPLEPMSGDTLPKVGTILHVIPVTQREVARLGLQGVDGELRKIVIASPGFSRREPNPNLR